MATGILAGPSASKQMLHFVYMPPESWEQWRKSVWLCVSNGRAARRDATRSLWGAVTCAAKMSMKRPSSSLPIVVNSSPPLYRPDRASYILSQFILARNGVTSEDTKGKCRQS